MKREPPVDESFQTLAKLLLEERQVEIHLRFHVHHGMDSRVDLGEFRNGKLDIDDHLRDAVRLHPRTFSVRAAGGIRTRGPRCCLFGLGHKDPVNATSAFDVGTVSRRKRPVNVRCHILVDTGVVSADDVDVAEGTTLSIRQLDTIALKVPADRRTVAKVLRGEPLSREPLKQAKIIRVAKRLFPNVELPASTNCGVP